jgi:predicted PurR-regulated permease PerM
MTKNPPDPENEATVPPPPADIVARPAARAAGAASVLAVFAFLAICWAAKDLLVPVMLAAFLAAVANPLVKRLCKFWIPRWVGALGVVFGGLVITVFLASQLVGPAATWVKKAPTELRQLAPKLKSLTRQVEQANKAAESIVKAAGASTPATTVAAVDKPRAPNLWTVISGTPRAIAEILAVVLLSYFFLVFGEKVQRQAIAQLRNRRHKRLTIDILRTIESDLSTYVLTISGINILLGLVLTAALTWLGLDLTDALLWGTVAALLNFIPYVGPLSGVILLAVVGVVAFDRPAQMVIPPLLYLGLHVAESQLVTPIVLGKRMAISPLIMLLWLMLWGWLWGIAGLLLAVPMLVSCKIVAERVEGWKGWAKVIE